MKFNLQVNANGTAVFCKFHLKTQQGVHNLTASQARNLTAEAPDYAQRDLYNAIENGDFPKWDMKIQVINTNWSIKYCIIP
jgi:catalase